LRILQTRGLKAAPTHTHIQRVEDGSRSLFVVGISAFCIQKTKLWIVGMYPDCGFQRPDLATTTDPPSFLLMNHFFLIRSSLHSDHEEFRAQVLLFSHLDNEGFRA